MVRTINTKLTHEWEMPVDSVGARGFRLLEVGTEWRNCPCLSPSDPLKFISPLLTASKYVLSTTASAEA